MNRVFRSVLLLMGCLMLVSSLAPKASFSEELEGSTKIYLPIVSSGGVTFQGGETQLGTSPVEPPRPTSQPQVLPKNAPLQSYSTAATLMSETTIDARVLVISADGNEVSLPAIEEALEYIGVPYDLWITTEHPEGLTEADLFDEDHGFYQGVILTTGSLGYFNGTGWVSGLSWGEWLTLWNYEVVFGVRQVTWYTYPTYDYGFEVPGATGSPTEATLTAEGEEVFSYINADYPVTIKYAYTYLAPVATLDEPTQGTVTPLLVDDNNNALVALRTYTDGRQNLAMTFDHNPYLVHSLQLAYGAINWVTDGVFLGDRRIYMSAHIDDIMISANIWPPDTVCGTDPETTGVAYRMDGDDLTGVLGWQQELQTRDTLNDFRLDMVFNGEGAEPGYWEDETLMPALTQHKDEFKWINHTYTHLLLNEVNFNTATWEISQNNILADQLNLQPYTTSTMVTPEVSGLYNPDFLNAAYNQGVRYLVSDTSRPDQTNPSPNAGIYNWHRPEILMIPRRATNLFYNVSLPQEWVAEYNCLYNSFWGRNLSYEEILDKESDLLVMYLLRGEYDPWMFHETNLRVFAGDDGEPTTLLGDLLDVTLEKYHRFYTLPIESPTMDALGERMAERMSYNDATINASITGDTLTISANQDVVVPVTGLQSEDASFYGGQYISYIELEAGETVTMTLQ